MMEIGKFKGKYRIETNRLRGYDYSSNGMYFVTICTKEKIHYFGDIIETRDCASNTESTQARDVETHDCASHDCGFHDCKTHNRASLRATEMGRIANEYWLSIPEHYPFVVLDEFIVMPNHMHGIISINKNETSEWKPNTFSPQSRNLSAIVRAFKSSVKKYANDNNIDFYWQARFFDHIITDEKTLFAVRNYIKSNPEKWPYDKDNEQGLKM